MIVVRITSGLGNQMFQYSFYLLMKKMYGDRTKVLCDVTWFNANNDHHGYELERVFSYDGNANFKIDKAGFSDLFKVTGILPNSFGKIYEKIRRYPNRIIREITGKSRKEYILDQFSTDSFFEKILNLDVSKDYYITGFFIEEKYYLKAIDEIKKALVFSEVTEEHNKIYFDEIQNTNSVSIHVRRGDYLSETYRNQFISLGKDYYDKAIDYITTRVDKPVFFIFSDDEEFVRHEFSSLENKVIVTGNNGEQSYRDMQLMSLCKHNIIANSTFSQWGAILNSNEGHITIYPSQYLNGEDSEIKEADNWIRI